MTHANSLAAYRRLNLTKSQEIVVRAIRRETIAGRPATIDSIFRQYGLMPTSTSARIGELKEMAEAGQAFELDGEEWALVLVGKQLTASNRWADAYKLEKFAVVRAAWLERNRGQGEQAKLNF